MSRGAKVFGAPLDDVFLSHLVITVDFKVEKNFYTYERGRFHGLNLHGVLDAPSDPLCTSFVGSTEKLIKELPSLVPSEITATKRATDFAEHDATTEKIDDRKPAANESGDDAREEESFTMPQEPAVTQQPPEEQQQQHHHHHHGEHVGDEKMTEGAEPVEGAREQLGKSPGEVAFFKLLHAEFKKATYFFDKAQTEFEIREERVREGMEIMKQPNSIMVNEKWSMLAKSIFKLYKDLLLLETYAIMAYCAFSKILKKHDKVTGHKTRAPFMTNVVNKANFTHYPKLLGMISRSERLYAEVSQRLQEEGKEGLYEDERLFINMISRLNEQVIESPDGEGAGGPHRKETARLFPPVPVAVTGQSKKGLESADVFKLRTLVEEHDARINSAEVSEGAASETAERKRAREDSIKDNKRSRVDSS